MSVIPTNTSSRYGGVLLFVWLCLSSFSLLQAQERIGLSLDRNQVLIGDPVQLKIEIQLSPEATIEGLDLNFDQAVLISTPPPNPGNGGLVPATEESPKPDLEIQQAGKWKVMPDTSFILGKEGLDWDTLSSGNTTILVNTLQIIPWDAGVINLASMDLSFTLLGEQRQLQSNVLELRVANPDAPSINSAVDSLGIAPIKDIREEPLTIQDVIPWALGFVGILIIGFLLWYFLRPKAKEIPIGPRTRRVAVHQFSLEKLEHLKKEQLWQQGKVKAYQSQLTFIVREYLENRYGIQALESSTSEIQDQMKSLDFSEDHKTQLREMLQLADMVKFAKAEPEATVHNRLMEYSENFIRQTKPTQLTEESNEGWLEIPIKGK